MVFRLPVTVEPSKINLGLNAAGTSLGMFGCARRCVDGADSLTLVLAVNPSITKGDIVPW